MLALQWTTKDTLLHVANAISVRDLCELPCDLLPFVSCLDSMVGVYTLQWFLNVLVLVINWG